MIALNALRASPAACPVLAPSPAACPTLTPSPASSPAQARILDAFATETEYILVSTYLSPGDMSVGPPGWKDVGVNEYEPVRCFSLPKLITDQRAPVPPPTRKHRYELVVATMFSEAEDAAALVAFHAYYSAQGVDQFFLWYNGPLSEVAAKLPALSNTQWGEWNFQYNQSAHPNFAKLGLHRHYAQPAFLTMFTKRFLPHCGHAIMLDVDEYMLPLTPRTTLRQYFANNTDPVVQVQSSWSTLVAPGILRVNSNVIPRGREKCVYRGTYSGRMGIHGPKGWSPSLRTDLMVAHVVDVIHSERTSWVNLNHSALWRLGQGWCPLCPTSV